VKEVDVVVLVCTLAPRIARPCSATAVQEDNTVKSGANYHFASVLYPCNLLSAMFTNARTLKRNTSTRRKKAGFDTDSVVK
jgi:hypothetical protein